MLGILAIVAVVVMTIQIYKTANSNGRSGPLWALVTLVVGLGFQIALPLMIGLILGVIYIAQGTDPDDLQAKLQEGPILILGFVTIILSFVGIWLIHKFVSRVPDDPPETRVPPPPTFGGSGQA